MESKQCGFIFALLVANRYGVLRRVSNLFAVREINIVSLTLGKTENPAYSRITINAFIDGCDVKDKIIKQLQRLRDVQNIELIPAEAALIRELMLIKLRAGSSVRREIIDAVNIFRCKVVDYTPDEICIEVTGYSSKIDAFVNFVKPFGIIEMQRTGVIAVERGSGSLTGGIT